MGRFSLIILAGLVLTACTNTTTAPVSKGATMPAIDLRGESVDPLAVAHNLMAADQPELALRAYYRAAATAGATVPNQAGWEDEYAADRKISCGSAA